VTVEREVKLPASPAFVMPSLDALPGGVRVMDRGDATLHTVYYDAPDLRLIRDGASLRYREGQSWTVKLPAAERGVALTREEIEFPDDGGVVPAEAVHLLRASLRTADVVPVLRLWTVRRRWEVVNDGVLVEIVDDHVDIVSGAPGRVTFRELEVERKHDASDALVDSIVQRLRAAGAGPPDPTPKPARALGAIAAAPPDVVVDDLPDEPTAGDVVRRALARSVLHLIRHDPVVRLDADPEGVHQTRVATRRLRSDLRTFRPLLDESWVRGLRAEIAWLGGALGAARDLDVLVERIRARTASLDDTELPAAAEIVGAIERRDKDAHAAVIDALTSARYADLLDALVVAANAPSFSDRAARPASEELPTLVRAPWKQLRAAVADAGERPTSDALHRIRVGAKRLRYAAEAVATIAGKPAERLAARAEQVQDVLGEHHDAVVAGSWLRSWASDASADGAFAAGTIAGMESVAAAKARGEWAKAWRALDRRELRGWM
jgi:CHAD domain-containing protein